MCVFLYFQDGLRSPSISVAESLHEDGEGAITATRSGETEQKHSHPLPLQSAVSDVRQRVNYHMRMLAINAAWQRDKEEVSE